MTKERAKAIVGAACVLAAEVLAAWGVSLDAGALADGAFALLSVVAAAWGVWKNHNFTDAAAQGQLVADALKGGGDPEPDGSAEDGEA